MLVSFLNTAFKWAIIQLLNSIGGLNRHMQSMFISNLTFVYAKLWRGVLQWRGEEKRSFKLVTQIASEIPVPHRVFNTMRYRSSERVQRSGYFHSSVSYIKVQIMF